MLQSQILTILGNMGGEGKALQPGGSPSVLVTGCKTCLGLTMGLKIRTVNRSFPSTKMSRKVEQLIGAPQQSQVMVLDLTVTTTEGREAWGTQGQQGQHGSVRSHSQTQELTNDPEEGPPLLTV